MINYLDLARRLRGKSVKVDAFMPWAYQFANPQGRPYHDDWQIPWLPGIMQPWGKIRRMDTTFLLPMPMRLVKAWGPVEPAWVAWQEGYRGGLSPDAKIRETSRGREVLAYHPVLPSGQAAVYSVWLDGEWRPCYYTKSALAFGRRLHTNRGLKPDITHGDMMWNYPEASFSWTHTR